MSCVRNGRLSTHQNSQRRVSTLPVDQQKWVKLTRYMVYIYPFYFTNIVQGQIRTVIGQAQLIISQRFKQFSGLVDNCEFKLGEKETTCTDLQGFWDMIYFQVQ